MADIRRTSTGNGTGSMSHAGRSAFIDHTQEVLAQLNANAPAFLQAMGIEAVKCVNQQMESGYGKPIWQTGDLMRDVSYQVNASENTVTIGNTLEYARYVHDGTSKMAARPYLRDAIIRNQARILEVGRELLRQGL